MEREAALVLLEKTHEFPCMFGFRAVIRPTAESAVVAAMRAALPQQEISDVRRKSSSKGNYTSLRVEMWILEPEQVLEVYAVLGQIEGVITTL